jgi:hypothetical protein
MVAEATAFPHRLTAAERLLVGVPADLSWIASVDGVSKRNANQSEQRWNFYWRVMANNRFRLNNSNFIDCLNVPSTSGTTRFCVRRDHPFAAYAA